MPWTCPHCDRELRNPNQWHNCVKVNLDDLFIGKAEELVLIFDKLLSEIMDWEGVVVSATQNCVVFVHHQTFLIIRPMKTQLDLKFYSTEENHEPPIKKSIPYSGRYENHIRLSRVEEVSVRVLSLVKRSYDLL